MKKFYVMLIAGALLVSNSFLALAQSDTLRNKLDAVFQHLDKSQIPTGFLAEYGYPFIPLDLFNNTLTDSSRTNLQAFRYAFATFYSARVLSGNALPTLDTVNARIAAAAQSYSAIPIALLHADYATLRPDALTANLLRVQDDQLYDVAGRTQSPYLQKTAFLAAPVRSYSETGNVALVLPQEIYLQNNNKAVSSLKINFGDGRGFVQTSWGVPLSATYSTKGTRRIQVQLTYADGELLTSHFDLEVLKPACPTCRYGDFVWPVSFPAVAGSHSGGVAYVRYAGNHTQLLKPLIIAEGFDASRVAPELQRNYSIGDFLDEISNIRWPNNVIFGDALDDIGNYDLVFIDYNNGTDDIRRNAALFREVVAWVNANKAGTEPNVVMGISMGGLVARYGLAQMVKAGTNPQTRLLITHDSPHRGANTPLGLQALTRQSNVTVSSSFYSGALSPAIAQANALLDEPASQQMLILRATNATGGVATNTFLDGNYRSTITFPAGGPQPAYRTLATSLGSQCGVGSLAPYTELVRSEGMGFLSPIPWILSASIKTEIAVNALPDYSAATNRRLSLLRIYAHYRILFIPITNDLINITYYAPPNTLPWDGVPGGTQNVREQAGSSIPTVDFRILWFIGANLGTTLAGDFCFVPTVSALDVADLNNTTIRARYVGGVPSASTARVDNFIAQESVSLNGQNVYNQVHPRFTARNSQWLFNEMQGSGDQNLNCSSECSPYSNLSITGPDPVCTSATFSISNAGGKAITWSSSNVNLAIDANGNATVRNNFSGQVTVTAALCGSTVSRVVQVGVPLTTTLTPPSQARGYDICADNTVVFMASAPGATTYQWTVTGGTLVSGQGGSYVTVRTPGVGGQLQVEVYAVNACSSSGQRAFQSYSTVGSIGGYFCFSDNRELEIAPNPSSDYLYIAVGGMGKDEEMTPTTRIGVVSSAEYQINLYNSYNPVKLLANTTREGKLTLDTSKLPNGIYYLRATRGTETSSRQIVIQH